MLKIKIIYRKLGREQAHGLASSDGVIEIDERLKGKKHLEILIHEVLQLLYPRNSEATIVKNSVLLTRLLWKEGYRRVDQKEDEPLQDGLL
jgi:hypothetical protein